MTLKADQVIFKNKINVKNLIQNNFLLNNFVNIIERKGYEWEILKDKPKKSEKYDYTNRIEGIDNAIIMQE